MHVLMIKLRSLIFSIFAYFFIDILTSFPIRILFFMHSMWILTAVLGTILYLKKEIKGNC